MYVSLLELSFGYLQGAINFRTQLFNPIGLQVKSGNVKVGGKMHGQGQADITQPDHGNFILPTDQ
jgi:hypothetical protein